MTRKVLCEIIQRSLAGGEPSSDFEPTLNEINRNLDFAIAYAAKVQYSESAQVDIEYIADSFYTDFNNIVLTKDADTGYWEGLLPGSPAGLPRGYDIEVFPYRDGRVGKALTRVTPQQLGLSLRRPKNAVLYWTSGNKLKADAPMDLTGQKFMVRMVIGAGDQNLTAELYCDGGHVNTILQWMNNHYRPQVQTPKDNSNDGINAK